MNKAAKFWLTLMNLLLIICMSIFIFFMAWKETFIFRKEYCLLIVPFLLYTIAQFAINYGELIEE